MLSIRPGGLVEARAGIWTRKTFFANVRLLPGRGPGFQFATGWKALHTFDLARGLERPPSQQKRLQTGHQITSNARNTGERKELQAY